MLVKEVVEIMKLYYKTNPRYIKNNIYYILKSKKIKIKEISKLLDVPFETAKSYINCSHPSKVSFETALKICDSLNIEIYSLLVENNRQLGKAKNKKWTEETKRLFIIDYETIGIVETSEKWKLKEKSVKYYYSLFKQK